MSKRSTYYLTIVVAIALLLTAQLMALSEVFYATSIKPIVYVLIISFIYTVAIYHYTNTNLKHSCSLHTSLGIAIAIEYGTIQTLEEFTTGRDLSELTDADSRMLTKLCVDLDNAKKVVKYYVVVTGGYGGELTEEFKAYRPSAEMRAHMDTLIQLSMDDMLNDS